MSFSEYTADSLRKMHKAEIARLKEQNPGWRVYDTGFKVRVTNDAAHLWSHYRTSADQGAAEHGISQRL